MRRVAAHLPGQNSPIGRLNPPSLPYRTEPGGTFYGQLALKGESKGPDICYSAAYTSQTRDQQRFTISEVTTGMIQWCRSALCGHPVPPLTDNWTRGAASRRTIAPISHTGPSPRSRSYYLFPVPLRVGG